MEPNCTRLAADGTAYVIGTEKTAKTRYQLKNESIDVPYAAYKCERKFIDRVL